ncbi:helix-turn-helix domain-containing protein [Myceligenerans pegani]|uniref:Helix-turn-helix transcriptional regulator n=1 Tax=Myceligenerans pegani TaxID=2776917 RepID=A0ABR9MZ78_9MICO|nr:helix-turn-helix transcriptional regulator [Myceligenerans sp. TRM 65318]MBE1876702.1 helix-turn-helix transcriptional regulator [Myceligenerans sp. TRM 65318]MBE3018973.1 helix-turn-helix transcriptional regulator [Myceligenerans sp. TRM 65318]
MTGDGQEAVGSRIATYRKLAGYTQREFSDHAHLSLGAIRKVEQGERLPTYGFLNTAARTLAVSVEELTGQPYRGRERADARVHAPIAAIRAIARTYDLPPEWRTAPRPLNLIARDVDQATTYRAAARYTALGEMLPALLEELTACVHQLDGKARRRAARLLASGYYMAYSLASRLGYVDLASLLEDRLQWASGMADDPLSVGLAQWTRANGFQIAKDYDAGLRLLERAYDQLQADVGDTPSGPAVTLLGSIRLRQVTQASRARDEDATLHHLAEARRLAELVPDGVDRVHYHLTFGPVNTTVHEIAAQIELKHADIAAERARTLQLPASMPRTRRGHHLIDAARAFIAVGDRDAALDALQQARTVAPQQTRYHPMAREAVRVLASHNRKVGEDVRALAAWMGSATTDTP